jgi:endonuclease/exonuclease/phosphatase (EEP) superfamily protein YafD
VCLLGSSVMRKVAASLFAIALSGCFSVPVAQQAMQFDSPGLSPTSPFCEAIPEPSVHGANQDTGLDPDRIRILTWNVHKGANAGWLTDLAWFGAENDIILIQEARLSDPLRNVLHDDDLHWTLAEAFRFRSFDTGVLTAARVRPDHVCMLRAMEPITRIPKAVVMTSYPISHSFESLLVVNVHAVNFTLGTTRLREQLEAVADVLARHSGPVLLAGDFNTWSAARRRAVDAIALRLGLQALSLEPDERSRFLGQPVDQMYYRGLIPSGAIAVRVRSSDHNPVSAVFRLAGINSESSNPS